ncbi:MAG: ASCH domain-containing protein [Nanoarchaeota archaeon]|nr:ASCH domain-containing protein [Nanoarchaeota archaeon]
MKALSLKQPWAELVLQGRKVVELRKWNTNFRGEFLIHSSKVPDLEGMKRFGFDELPNGFIVGKAKLIGVKKYSDNDELEKDNSKHLAETGEWGGYGFLLEDVKRINAIPAKGKLNFWDFKEELK